MSERKDLDSLACDVESFLRHAVGDRGLSDNTIATYGRCLNWFTAFAAEGGMADYLAPKAAEISSYLQELHDKGLSPASKQLGVASLKLLYRWLAAQGRLTDKAALPVTLLSPPKVPERLPRVLSLEEVRRLLDAPRRSSRTYLRDRAMLLFLYGSACRVSEATGLLLRDLNLADGTARVIGKGDKERVVLMGEHAAQALHSYIEMLRPELSSQQIAPPPWLFITTTGKRMDRELVWQVVSCHAEYVGLPKWTSPHSLRHAAATHFVRNGGDVRFVMELLGHSNVATSSIYLSMDVSRLREVHQLFEEYRHRSKLEEQESEKTNQEQGVGSPCSQRFPPLLPLSPYCGRLVRGRYRLWSKDEDELVRAFPTKEVAECIGRSVKAVKTRRWELSLSEAQKPSRTLAEDDAATPVSGRRWSIQEDLLVRSLPSRTVAQRTGRTLAACRCRAATLLRRDRLRKASEKAPAK